MNTITVKRLDKNLPMPAYQTSGSVGVDLYCAKEQFRLFPYRRILVPTGIRINLPYNVEGQIRPRSGLAYKHGITVLNAPATVDSDYRGEISVLLYNASDVPYTFNYGDRIAQLVFGHVMRKTLVPEEQFTLLYEDTERGESGFGSTGV